MKGNRFVIIALVIAVLTSCSVLLIQPSSSDESAPEFVQFTTEPPTLTDEWDLYGQDGYDYRLVTSNYTLYAKANSAWGDGFKFAVNINGTEKSLIYQPSDYSYRNIYHSQDYLGGVTNVQGALNVNSMSYVGLFPNVALNYRTYDAQIKENFMVYSLPRAPQSWLGDIAQNQVTLDFGGYIKYGDLKLYTEGEEVTGMDFITTERINFVYNGSVLFYLPKPIAIDNTGSNVTCTYEVDDQGGQIWFYTRTPYSWLQTAVFPVEIDPTVNFGTSGNPVYATTPSAGTITSISYSCWVGNGFPEQGAYFDVRLDGNTIDSFGDVWATVQQSNTVSVNVATSASQQHSLEIVMLDGYGYFDHWDSASLDYTLSQVTITITSSGIGGDSSGTVATLNGVTRTQAQLPYSVDVNPGSTVTWSFSSPISAGSDKRYTWSSTSGLGQSGQSGSFSASTTGTVTGSFGTQFLLTVTGGDSSTTGYNNDQWYDSGTSGVTSTTNKVYNTVTSQSRSNVYAWRVDGGGWNYPSRGGSGTYITSSVTMSSAHTFEWASLTQYYLTVSGGNGVTYGTASQTGDNWYDSGSSSTVSSNGVWSRTTTGTRVNWWKIDSGNQNNVATTGTVTTSSVSMSTYHTVTFNAITQNKLTVSGGNSISYGTGPSISGDTGWYDSGVSTTVSSDWVWNTVPITSRTAITNWALDSVNQNPTRQYSGTLTTSSVTMNAAHIVSFSSTTQYYLTVASSYSTTSGEGWYDSSSTAYAGVASSPVTDGTTRYVFASWTGDASGSTYSQSNGINMNAAKTATATWATQYYLTVTTVHGTPSGQGWYNSGSTAYAAVDSETVSGDTGIHYVFSSWGTDATGTSYAQSNGITMNSAKTATSTWITQYTITPSADSNSNIYPNTAQNINSGNNQAFYYSASTGYRISQILVDGSPISLVTYPEVYTFTDIQSPHTITVYSELDAFIILPSADENCSISPSAAQIVSNGGSKTFYYSANPGFKISQVLVDGSPIDLSVYPSSYTFLNANSNHTISVTSSLRYIVVLSRNGDNPLISQSVSIGINVLKGNSTFFNYLCNITKNGFSYSSDINQNFWVTENTVGSRVFNISGFFDVDEGLSITAYEVTSLTVTWILASGGGAQGASDPTPSPTSSTDANVFKVVDLDLGTMQPNSSNAAILRFSFSGSSYTLKSLTFSAPFDQWVIHDPSFTSKTYVLSPNGQSIGEVALTLKVPDDADGMYKGTIVLEGVDAFGVVHTDTAKIAVVVGEGSSGSSIFGWIQANPLVAVFVVLAVVAVVFFLAMRKR